MESKVLIVYLPGVETGYGPIFPLGLGYLLSSLKQDRPVKAVHYEQFDQVYKHLSDTVSTFSPDIVGLTCSSFNRGNVRKACKWIRENHPNIKIVIGGVHASFFPEQFLHDGSVDYVVIGEGEITIRELCNAIDHNDSLSTVKGLVYKAGQDIVKTEPREVVFNIDDIPIPDYSYAHNMMKRSGLGFVFTARGCPAHCHFCSTSNYWGQKVRIHTPKRIADEIGILVQKCGTRKILFHDDTFNLSIKRVIDICDEILARGLEVTWAASCRVHPVSQEMIDMMVKAGCRHICWGIESGSAEMLARINKKITQEQIKSAYEMCRKHIGTISVGAFAMVGNAGESETTIQESVDFINTLPLTDSPGAAALYILPGTQIYEDVRRKRPDVDNFWLESDGILRPQEFPTVRLQQWAMKIAQSGERVPFDRNTHFFNNVLFGNIPAPVLEEI